MPSLSRAVSMNKDKDMNHFVENIEELSKANTYFRRVVKTGRNAQIVLMSIVPGSEIGEEVHVVDQIIVIVEGEGLAVLDGQTSPIFAGTMVYIPESTMHNIKNVGQAELKLYSIYAPPQHPDGTIHKTREEAEALEEE